MCIIPGISCNNNYIMTMFEKLKLTFWSKEFPINCLYLNGPYSAILYRKPVSNDRSSSLVLHINTNNYSNYTTIL